MQPKSVIPIVDTMIETFALMGVGHALGLQVKELARRIHIVQDKIEWNANLALAASKMRAMAAIYAMQYVPDEGRTEVRSRNEAHLDKLRAAFLEFRAHVQRQERIDDEPPGGTPDSTGYRAQP